MTYFKSKRSLLLTLILCFGLSLTLTAQVKKGPAFNPKASYDLDYQNKNMEAFEQKSQKFLELIDDMDMLLATRKDFLLGRWLNSAKRLGQTKKEKKLFERNARDLITLWLDKDCNIHEYACKERAGMMKGFYRPRWVQFFAEVKKNSTEGNPSISNNLRKT